MYTTEQKLAENLWDGLLEIKNPAAVARFKELDKKISILEKSYFSNIPKRGEGKEWDFLQKQRKALAREMPVKELALKAPISCLYKEHGSSMSAKMNRILRDYILGKL